MTDRDSINLEQAYAHASFQRQCQAEWDQMAEQIIEKHHDELVAEGVIEEGLWDSIKSGAGKVAGAVSNAWQGAKTAVKDKLMMPVVKMLQQKFPDAFNKLVQWAQQNPNAKDFSQVADKAVSESIYQHLRTINEDCSKDYPLDDWWAESRRVEHDAIIIEARQQLDEAWKLFHEMVPTSMVPDHEDPSNIPGRSEASKLNYVGRIKQDGDELKRQLKGFLAKNPKQRAAGRFKQIEDLLNTALATSQRGAYFGQSGDDTPAPGGEPAGGEPAGGEPAGGDDMTITDPGGDTPPADPGAAPPVLPGDGTAPAPGATPDGGAGEKAGGMLSKVWNWIKQNPGKAATFGGLAALLLFVGLTPVTLLGLVRAGGIAVAQGAAAADPDVMGQAITTTMAP